jgi:dienelactone hydrolase
MSMVLVDESRSTDAGAATEAQPARTLDTDVYIPAGTGPFPLVVFGHGLSGHPDDFTRLLGAWAEAGYLVAAPAFPLTNVEVPDSGANLGDVINQPGDVTFVIDEMTRLDGDAESDLAGLVDLEHVGVAGLSLGGITTYAAAFSECCRDERIDASVVLAGTAGTSEEFGAFEASGDTPTLVMHGDADAVIGHGAAVEAYALLAPPKYFVTLLGGGHAEPFSDQSTDFAPIVDRVTTDFWGAYLDDDPEALAALVADAEVDGLTTFEYDD